MDVDVGTCISASLNTLVHTVAFLSFNPDDIGQNYLGDVGATDEVFSFQFTVPGNSEFVVVGQQILDIDADNNGENCVFSVVVSDDSGCP